MHQVNFDLSGLHYCPLDDNASCDVFPKCDEKLSRQCRDHDLADPSTFTGDALLEPTAEQGIRLMSLPQPGQLDHGCPQPRVSRFGDPLFAVERPTLRWCCGKSGVSCNLSPVVKVAKWSFRPQSHRKLGTDPFEAHQHLRRHGQVCLVELG